jgi:hypothetical protein
MCLCAHWLLVVQVKTKGARRITFEQFLTALSKLAERKVGGLSCTRGKGLEVLPKGG